MKGNFRSTSILLFIAIFAGLIVIASLILLPSAAKRSDISIETKAILDLANSGNLDQAIDRALEALKMSPEQEELQQLLASTLLQKGSAKFDEKGSAARANITSIQLASAKPSSPLGYYLLGYSSEIKEDYRQAYSWYNAAIALDPSAAYLYSARGHAYDLDGQIEKAEADHKRALALDPNDITALVNIARIELRRGKYDEATVFAKKAFEADGNIYIKAEALLVQGYCAIQNGNIEDAIALMSQAELLTPKSPSILLGVAQAKFASLPKIKKIENYEATINTIFNKTQLATQINQNHSLAYLIAARTFKIIGNNDAAQNLYQIAARACLYDITLSRTEKKKICADITKENNLEIK